jgi:N4-gp56 family major capsid protein
MSVNVSSNFSGAVSTYIAQKTLMLAMKRLALYQIADKPKQPFNHGKVFQYVRYDRVALPQSALSEGVTPGDTSMAISTVNATLDQWGAVIPLSDVAIQKAINLASLQAAETVDREIAKVLLTGTNVYFPNAITARGSLTTSDKLGSSVMGKVVANMRADGAIPYDGDLFLGVCDPFSEEDIMNDSTFIDAAKYGAIKKLYVNEVGTWKGVRWVRSNSLPAVALLSGASAASSATAGSLVASTAYDVKVTMVDAQTGHETYISAKVDVSTDAAETSVDVTIPSLPSGAPAGSTFNVYIGSDGGTMYLASTGAAAGATVNVGSVPSSGNAAPATPPASMKIHFGFIFGQEGLACAELRKIEAFLTPKGSSDSDPLAQRRKVGWKAMFKAFITNEDFISRIEHYTTHGN